jgi:hypothetical protein
MSASESALNLDILKRVYVDPVDKAVVLNNIVQENVKFDEKNRTGGEYVTAIQVRRPQGFTYASEDAMRLPFTINPAVGGVVVQPKMKPSAIVLQDLIAYDLASSTGSDSQAFNPQLGLVFTSIRESHDQQFNTQAYYGGLSLGETNTNTGTTPTAIQQVSKASWSPHIFGPIEGALIDVYSNSTLTTKITTDGPATLLSVDSTTRTLTITYASAANYTAADTAKASLFIVMYGSAGNVAPGIRKILDLSIAGSTLWTIDTSLYAYMRANTYDAAGALTFAKLASASTGSAGKGGLMEMNATVNLFSFTDMMNDQAALRRYTEDKGGEFVNGGDKLTYYGVGGKLTIQCDPLLKASEALLTNWDDWCFAGSSMPTFNIGGGGPQGPRLVLDAPQNAGWITRRWSQASPFCDRLGRQTLITGIVNSSGPAGGGT